MKWGINRYFKTKSSFLVVLLVIWVTLPFWTNPYILSIITMIGIYAILALGLNIFFGYCGQINFGAAACYAIGAYTSILIQNNLGWHFFAAIPAAMVAAGIAALIVGYPLLRLRGHTLALGTFAFAMSIRYLAVAMIDVTGGGEGTVSPTTTILGHMLGDNFFFYFIWAFVAVCFLGCEYILHSRFGRAFMAIRENEVVASAMGINVALYRHIAYILNGVYGGLAGALFAQQTGWINPDCFGLLTNLLILMILVVGGIGSNWGALVGAAIVMGIPEVLAGFPHQLPIFYGVVILVVLLFMPGGVSGSVFTIRNLFKRLFGRLESHRGY